MLSVCSDELHKVRLVNPRRAAPVGSDALDSLIDFVIVCNVDRQFETF